MASVFDWVKLGLENAKVILPVLVLLLSGLGLTVKDNIAKAEEIKDSQSQIAAIANYYTAPKKECCNLDEYLREHH